MPIEDTITCDTCGGHGVIRRYCNTCDGGNLSIDCSECNNTGSIQVPCPEDSPHEWTEYTCQICEDWSWDVRGDDLEAAARCANHEAACSRNNS